MEVSPSHQEGDDRQWGQWMAPLDGVGFLPEKELARTRTSLEQDPHT